jgi:hypothetical protein
VRGRADRQGGEQSANRTESQKEKAATPAGAALNCFDRIPFYPRGVNMRN